MLGATVRANYAKPSVDRVQEQALSVWSVLYVSLGSDVNVPETDRWFFVAGEYWTKYVLYLYLSVHDARKALRKFLAAGDDPAAKSRAEDEMLDAIQFKVFDVERQKLVDEKEFQDKHFVDE